MDNETKIVLLIEKQDEIKRLKSMADYLTGYYNRCCGIKLIDKVLKLFCSYGYIYERFEIKPDEGEEIANILKRKAERIQSEISDILTKKQEDKQNANE
jgi:hypothetical protein